MLRILPHTVPRVDRSYEHFPDGFELHLLQELDKKIKKLTQTRQSGLMDDPAFLQVKKK